MSSDVKLVQSKPKSKASNPQSIEKVADFANEVKAEINRIHWTSKEELVNYTKIVICATFIAGLAIYLLDLTIQAFLSSLSYVVQVLIG